MRGKAALRGPGDRAAPRSIQPADLSEPGATILVMSDSTSPQPQPHSDTDLVDLSDPVAAVIVAELASRFVQLCLAQTEPVIARLARHEGILRKPGGIALETTRIALDLYLRIDTVMFRTLSLVLPLARASEALSRIESMLREQFADVAGTAASYLLSDGRDTAIQMSAVATTMAAREVRQRLSDILEDARAPECQA